MCERLYPWGGRFNAFDPKMPVAIVTLSEELEIVKGSIAIYGNMKTENLGVEKVVANVVSNPNIRFLIICGTDVRGHRSGESLIKLHENGLDSNNRVIGASSAVPFIENLPRDAIARFKEQVEIVDMIGVCDVDKVEKAVVDCIGRDPGPYGEPMYIEMVSENNEVTLGESDLALHAGLEVDTYGVVWPAAHQDEQPHPKGCGIIPIEQQKLTKSIHPPLEEVVCCSIEDK